MTSLLCHLRLDLYFLIQTECVSRVFFYFYLVIYFCKEIIQNQKEQIIHFTTCVNANNKGDNILLIPIIYPSTRCQCLPDQRNEIYICRQFFVVVVVVLAVSLAALDGCFIHRWVWCAMTSFAINPVVKITVNKSIKSIIIEMFFINIL